MTQQTAVDWLEEKLDNLLELYPSDWEKVNEVIEQAKQMEKEQIIKSNRDGVDMCVDKKPFITGEQYYNETFGGQGSPDTSPST